MLAYSTLDNLVFSDRRSVVLNTEVCVTTGPPSLHSLPSRIIIIVIKLRLLGSPTYIQIALQAISFFCSGILWDRSE